MKQYKYPTTESLLLEGSVMMTDVTSDAFGFPPGEPGADKAPVVKGLK